MIQVLQNRYVLSPARLGVEFNFGGSGGFLAVLSGRLAKGATSEERYLCVGFFLALKGTKMYVCGDVSVGSSHKDYKDFFPLITPLPHFSPSGGFWDFIQLGPGFRSNPRGWGHVRCGSN